MIKAIPEHNLGNQEMTYRMAANAIWNKLNFALSLIHNGASKEQLFAEIKEAQAVANSIVMDEHSGNIEAELAACQARCRELEKEIGIVSNYRNCFSCEHYDAKMEECKDSNSECNYTPKAMFRCADRDDGCGYCPRSEPHTHPDEQPGDDCDRMGKRVTCERV
jgi:hypothetical protein